MYTCLKVIIHKNENRTSTPKKVYTLFLLLNASGAMQNIDREPLFCTQFAKQNICPTLHFFVF